MATGLMIASLIVGIIASLVGTGASVYQVGLTHLSSNVKAKVQDIAHKVNEQIKAGRLNVTKLLSLLQSKNQNALLTYLYNNPIISKCLEEVQSNSDLIASLQAEQTSLENEIATLQNELNQLGYSSSVKGLNRESARAADLSGKLEQKKQEYDALAAKIQNTNLSPVRVSNTVTSDIDARSQNIQGGLI